ncbi:MAG: TRAP transporter large permease subunit [Lachnospiraceae bacterium]|nr:TRAP transporter large permease subunit [Lachnospiraceae bacterium]
MTQATAILIFFLIYLITMMLGFTPMIFSMGAAALAVPLFFSGISSFSVADIASAFMTGAYGTNTGMTIILFVLSGDIMSSGKISEKIFNIFAYFLGKRKGFMPILCILTAMFYGAISGSGPATTAAVGAMCFPVLVSLGYDKFFSAAILVAAGCLGVVIPPSVPVTGVSALSGGLDLVVLYKLSAVVVGVICGLMMIIYCFFYCLRNGNGDTMKINAWVDDLRSRGFGAILKDSIWAILMPVIILGSIFSGLADTAQAAMLSLIYAIIVSVFIYKSIKPSEIVPLIIKSLRGGAGMLVLIAFSTVFSNALTALDVSTLITNFVNNAQIQPVIIIVIIIFYQLFMGMVGGPAGVTVVVPLTFPIILATGIEPFTAGIAMVLMHAAGMVTPPVGLCLFVMTGMAKCDVTDLIKPLIPYVVIMVAIALVLVLFPGLFSGIVAGGYIPS